MIPIFIDEDAGFCFGVVKAIETAENKLKSDTKLYCLGDIVHNEGEIERLEKQGLITISRDQLPVLENQEVLIRAHGEAPETYQLAKKHNIRITDATCPIVIKLQERIKKNWESLRNTKGQIVIYGKANHPEVIGLNGQTDNEGIVVEGMHDLEKIDFHRPISMYSQTTKSLESYQELGDAIRQKAAEAGNKNIEIHPSVCRKVANRSQSLKVFAKKFDCILFVSGKKSSNGNYLYHIALAENPNTHFLSHPSEIKKEWISGAKSIGISGATSTPAWLMEDVRARAEGILNKRFY